MLSFIAKYKVTILLIALTFVRYCENPMDDLAIPDKIKIACISENVVKLTWHDNSAKETGFIIDKKTGESEWQEAYGQTDADATSFSDYIPTDSDTIFAYRIRAMAVGDTTECSETVAWISEYCSPGDLLIRQIGKTTVRMTWTDNSIGEDKFLIERKTSTGKWAQLAKMESNSTEYIDATASSTDVSDTLSYRVSATSGISSSPVSGTVKYLPGDINLSDLYFGTDQTFDLITWNIYNFPRNGTATIDSAVEAIRHLNADVIALQEISENSGFQELDARLTDWNGYRADGWGGTLAFLYRSENMTIDSVYEIYIDNNREFPRPPLVLDLEWNGNRVIVIDNHYKAYGDGVIGPDPYDEERRRLDASILLETYINTYFPGENVIVVGDFNDEITDAAAANVFQNFIDNSMAYRFADMSIAKGSSSNWSYPTWPSHLDHILVTNELFDELARTGTEVKTIHVDEYFSNGWNEYAVTLTDHRPVGIKVQF